MIMEQLRFTINNGNKIPAIWLWTFMISPADAEVTVQSALKDRCRLIDTANAYVNERAVWRWIKNSGVSREDIFVSTKLWITEYENPNAVDETLERLWLDYVDLLFIHQPGWNYMAWYKQLEKAYKEWKAKAIWISNFEWKYIEEILANCEIKPQVIQVEAHPYFTQDELRKTLDEHDIKLMSWYPLWHGDSNLINEPVFKELGEKYNKTPAQIILRWHIQMWFIVIPGSKNSDHIRDNFNLFDFELTDKDMEKIAEINNNERYYHRSDEQLEQFATWHPSYERE